jgi:chemotaxis protein MotB
VIASGTRNGRDRWLISYADLMTLLFAFFMTLYAAAEMKHDTAAVQPNDVPPQAVAKEAALPRPAVADDAHDAGLRDALERHLADAIGDGRLEIVNDARGLVVSLPETATFASASADVTPAAADVLRRVAVVLRPTPHALRIEGHTDDQPIRTSLYRSNWELSTARASAVVAFLIESAGLDPARLSAAGYGEHHPRVRNDSPASRSRNRRVDIVVLETP